MFTRFQQSPKGEWGKRSASHNRYKFALKTLENYNAVSSLGPHVFEKSEEMLAKRITKKKKKKIGKGIFQNYALKVTAVTQSCGRWRNVDGRQE